MLKYLSLICLLLVPVALGVITIDAKNAGADVGDQAMEAVKVITDDAFMVWGYQQVFRADGDAVPVDVINNIGGDAFLSGPYTDDTGEYWVATLTASPGAPIEIDAGTTTMFWIVWESETSGQTTCDLISETDATVPLKSRFSGYYPEYPFIIYADDYDDGSVSFMYPE